ncbi:MAG: DNA repair protein RadC [Nitrospirae bacterium]|nr:DNA repair protein RadC [Nitrospirota bacterium]
MTDPKVCINEWPEDERPRERLVREGAERLSPAQLLAILLRTGSEGKSAIELAMELINRFGDFRAMSGVTVHELCSVKGIGIAKACQIKAALEIGKRSASFPLNKKRRVISSKDIYDVYRHYIQHFHGLKKEIFRLVMLDGKNRIFSDYVVSEGCLTSSIVHPREVYIQAIKNSAASVIFLHNHPSGDPTPSPEDIEITKRLIAAGELIGIKVLDHIIMGEGEYLSFADKGLL